MLSGISKLMIVGALLVAPVIGCRGAHRRASNWSEETSPQTAYPAPEPMSRAPVPAAEEWVCPMHPSVKQSEPGKCPICGMALVRAGGSSGMGGSSSRSDDIHASGAGYSHPSGSGKSGSSGCGHCG